MKKILRNTSFVIASLFVLTAFLSCGNSKNQKAMKAVSEKEKARNSSAMEVYEWVSSINNAKNKAFENYMTGLSLEDKISQMFILNLEGNRTFRVYETVDRVNPENKSGKDLVAGGYLFFSYNLSETPEQNIAFTTNIRNTSIEKNIIPPFLAVDQEGGYVNRLRSIVGPLPSAERVSAILDLEKAGQLYSLQGRQMKSLGFDMNIAPVVEICTEDNTDFLSERSFGNKLQTTSYSLKAVSSYSKEGIYCVIKHFPGNTNTDPHTGLPEITLDKTSLMESLEPFGKVIRGVGQDGTVAKPQGVLMSHARTKAVDEGVPSCFSKEWVTEILKKQMAFDGIVFSDDIFMGALKDNGYPPETACVKAVEAGVNCIMISEKRFGNSARVLYKKALEDQDFNQKITESASKIIEYKLKAGILEYKENPDGTYYIESVILPSDSDSIAEKAEVFKKAKNQNISFYSENFQ